MRRYRRGMVTRKHTAVRLNPEAMAMVKNLAEKETDGNFSVMLRKLLGEALRARGL